MATTDAKSGFRLPWSADRNDSDGGAGAPVDGGDGAPQATGSETDAMSQAEGQPSGSATPPADASSSGSTAPVRKPNKFMADLTKAMQAAAEAARSDTLERFTAEAKTHIERIHTSTADEATELRKKADDDVAAIRDWSKTEIARIREETDERIAHRKDKLERQIEAHAGEIEARIEGVQRRVDRFEHEMAEFFERLLAEEDPTRFAAMAESLPEPPPFDDDPLPTANTSVIEPPAVDTESAPDEIVTSENEAAAEPPTGWESTPVTGTDPETSSDAAPSTEPVESSIAGWPGTDAAPTPTPVEAPADQSSADHGDLFGMARDSEPPHGGEPGASPEASVEPTGEGDPRLTALGLDPDLAAAEAEAGAFPIATETSDEPIPMIADDALAARLAGLVHEEPSGDTTTTRVIVTGLVSVASIAGFKRNLARVPGVQAVGVSSGPDGEFVFAVTHDGSLALSESIATLPGFGTRVTDEAPGQLTVAARDPEAEG
ncbi:MAG TPA: hypothetical protein VFJ80_07490 [Candidatus Limnocylindrales bacterium]|jgi:hypothetical protein|nr:hypothetical protein [Candidatus Limnocylindrales bacterium]